MTDSLPDLRIWLVHDWLTGMRGGELVLLELARMFPQAQIATLIHVPGSVDPEIERRVACVSWLNQLPAIGRTYRNLLPLFPGAIRKMHLTPCDLVISSSHCVAKAIPIPPGAKHLCYSHGFLRYIWEMEEMYVGRSTLKKLALRTIRPRLRRFDQQNDSVHQFVANSQHEANRIQKYYGRTSQVVYPGIDTDFFVPNDQGPRTNDQGFYLVVAKLVPFKRIDLVVDAFAPNGPLAGRRVVVLGDGPELQHLKRKAGPSVEFLGWAEREKVRWHYQHCRALLFPGEEHFGMTAVECQACGRPVIAYRKGGVCETVLEGKTGLFFAAQTVESLADAIRRLETMEGMNSAAIRENALRFNWEKFRAGITGSLQRLLLTASKETA